jgi:hypothetical protein
LFVWRIALDAVLSVIATKVRFQRQIQLLAESCPAEAGGFNPEDGRIMICYLPLCVSAFAVAFALPVIGFSPNHLHLLSSSNESQVSNPRNHPRMSSR